MPIIRNSIVLFSLLLSNSTYAQDATKKEEPKKIITPVKPKECFYNTHALAIADSSKFDETVKRIQEAFEKCEANLARAKDCKALHLQLREKKIAVLKLAAESSKLNKKDEFDKMVVTIKAAKDESAAAEAKYKESCSVGVVKEEPKKQEEKKEEPKKVEEKKEEPKKVEPKKEEPKKVEEKKEEPKKVEPKKEEKKEEPKKAEAPAPTHK